MKKGILRRSLAFIFAVVMLIAATPFSVAEDSSAAPSRPVIAEDGMTISVSCMQEGDPGVTSFATLQISVEGREDTGRYLAGETVTMTAEDAAGYLFSGWFARIEKELTPVSEEPVYTMTVSEDSPGVFVAVYVKETEEETEQTCTLSFSDDSCVVSGDDVTEEEDGVYRVVSGSIVTISAKDPDRTIWGYKEDGSFVSFQNTYMVEKDTVLTPVYQDSAKERYLWVNFYNGDTLEARIMAKVKDDMVYSVNAQDVPTLLSPENFAVAAGLQEDQRSFQGWLANGTTHQTFDEVVAAIQGASGQIRFDALWSEDALIDESVDELIDESFSGSVDELLDESFSESVDELPDESFSESVNDLPDESMDASDE